jgi:hypothetical protein
VEASRFAVPRGRPASRAVSACRSSAVDRRRRGPCTGPSVFRRCGVFPMPDERR